LREQELTISHLTKGQDSLISYFQTLDKNKVSRDEFEDFVASNGNRLEDMSDQMAQHGNDIKSVENYVEKYVPCNTQNLIIENLAQFVSKEIIHKLKS
jgi:hypothetical protein